MKKLWNTKYLTLMRARSRRAYARPRRRLLARMHSWPPARKSWARCKLQTHQPQLTEYDCEETLEHKVSYTHAGRFGAAVMRARSRRAYARRLLARTCILGHLRANHGRAASYRPTNHNLQSMTVKKLWSTKYLTLMRADSGRAVMRARSRRAYARRLLARMHSWPPARKSRARRKLQTHQPQLTGYDCEETLEHKVSYSHARRFGARCHARKVTARIRA